MKVNLVATITVNGQLLLTKNMPKVSVPPLVMGVFIQQANEAGNIIVGHHNYQMLMQTPALHQAFSGIETVLISKRSAKYSGCKTVSSPGEAVGYLRDKGYETAVLAGGLQTYNSFLNAGMVTDLYLSIVPVIIGDGGIMALQKDTFLAFHLAGQNILADNIIQLHYTKKE